MIRVAAPAPPVMVQAARSAVAVAVTTGLTDIYLESPQGGIVFWAPSASCGGPWLRRCPLSTSPGGAVVIEPMPVDILGIRVHAQTLAGAVDTLATWIDEREPHYACVTVGVHGVVECQRSEMLRRIHNEAGMVTTDGMPLVWLSRRRVNHPDRVERVYGPESRRRSRSPDPRRWTAKCHLLYGSTRETLDRLRRNLRARFPRAEVVGAISPPFPPRPRPARMPR